MRFSQIPPFWSLNCAALGELVAMPAARAQQLAAEVGVFFLLARPLERLSLSLALFVDARDRTSEERGKGTAFAFLARVSASIFVLANLLRHQRVLRHTCDRRVLDPGDEVGSARSIFSTRP